MSSIQSLEYDFFCQTDYCNFSTCTYLCQGPNSLQSSNTPFQIIHTAKLTDPFIFVSTGPIFRLTAGTHLQLTLCGLQSTIRQPQIVVVVIQQLPSNSLQTTWQPQHLSPSRHPLSVIFNIWDCPWLLHSIKARTQFHNLALEVRLLVLGKQGLLCPFPWN